MTQSGEFIKLQNKSDYKNIKQKSTSLNGITEWRKKAYHINLIYVDILDFLFEYCNLLLVLMNILIIIKETKEFKNLALG